MIMKIPVSVIFLFAVLFLSAQNTFEINEKGYFQRSGVDVTVFSDYYPEGHQSGVTIIQHGNRVATNGELRLSPSPGQ